MVLALGWVWDPPTPWAFSIAEPSAMKVVEPGQTIPVRIELGTEIGVRRVAFYWYRQGEQPLGPQQAKAALITLASSDPPFSGSLKVPEEAIGVMRVLAVGEVAGGRLAGREEFDEVLVRVEPSAELLQIEFEAEKPLKLTTIGRVLNAPVVGQFADGVVRTIGGASAGSRYRSSDDGVMRAYPSGLLRAVGNGTATITVMNRDKQGTLDVVIKGHREANEWPTADAGDDQTVRSAQTVALSGVRSMDPDGDPLQYQWMQVRGSKVSLLDFDTPKATFVAPKVSAKRLLRFKLRVTDMAGPDTVKGADSLPSFVNVWVIP